MAGLAPQQRVAAAELSRDDLGWETAWGAPRPLREIHGHETTLFDGKPGGVGALATRPMPLPSISVPPPLVHYCIETIRKP